MSKKKTFDQNLSKALRNDNPALSFISTPEAQSKQAQTTEGPPEGHYVVYVEKKTRRVQLVLRPSLYEKLKAMADAETGGSVNEAVSKILEEKFNQENHLEGDK